MRKEIKKHGHKDDSDSSAYGPWDADYKSRKAGVGKKIETKTSKYTKKYKEMFGENEIINFNLIPYEIFESLLFEEILIENPEISDEEILESSKIGKNSPVYSALKKKSEKTGFPLGILRQVWNRGYAAWKTGHIPGTTPQQWAMARVNSFLTGGKTTKMSDKSLYQRAKKEKKK